MSKAKANILERLQQAATIEHKEIETPKAFVSEDKQAAFIEKFTSVRGEVRRATKANWVDVVFDYCIQNQYTNLMVGSGDVGQALNKQNVSLNVSVYDASIETHKQLLFNEIQVGITQAEGAIAQSGSLIVKPTAHEPRLLSLVPDVHIALVHASQFYDSFAQVLDSKSWANDMPTNVLLISGPSKTADIEQVLAYGVHGPKVCVAVIINDA